MPSSNRKKSSAKKKTRRKVRRTRKNSEALTRRPRSQSKLTESLLKEAIELIVEGLPLESTCAYLGITQHTLYDWTEKGEKYLMELHTSRGPEFPEDVPEANFCLEIARAKATLELALIRELRDPKEHSKWVRNMTTLERRFRKNWGRGETLRTDTEAMAPDEAYL